MLTSCICGLLSLTTQFQLRPFRTVKFEEAGLIERLEFGDGRSRYEEAGEHHEHLVDIETGEVHEFYNEELETLKAEIAREMGYDLIDHRLELYGKKRKD